MTQEEKQKEKELLLSVLKNGLAYGLQLQITDVNEFTFNGVLSVLSKNWCRLNIADPVKRVKVKNQTIPLNSIYIKPYLRPLSSMTEEERKELQKITNNKFYASSNYISNSNSPLDGEWRVPYNSFITNAVCNKLISWLDEKHFDHRCDEEGKTLIEKGLAIAVTKENNPYENNNQKTI